MEPFNKSTRIVSISYAYPMIADSMRNRNYSQDRMEKVELTCNKRTPTITADGISILDILKNGCRESIQSIQLISYNINE